MPNRCIVHINLCCSCFEVFRFRLARKKRVAHAGCCYVALPSAKCEAIIKNAPAKPNLNRFANKIIIIVFVN